MVVLTADVFQFFIKKKNAFFDKRFCVAYFMCIRLVLDDLRNWIYVLVLYLVLV